MTGDQREIIADLRDFLCRASEGAILEDAKLDCQMAHEALDSLAISIAAPAPAPAHAPEVVPMITEVSHG